MLTKVYSSNLSSVEYDDKRQTLAIVFRNVPNITYLYKRVPKGVYNELMNSTSKGEFFHKEIKNNYQFVKTFN